MEEPVSFLIWRPSSTGEDNHVSRKKNLEQVFRASQDCQPVESGGFQEDMSVEKVFKGQRVPLVMFSVVMMKLNLTTGIIPSLNASAGLFGFFFVKSWIKLLEKNGFLKHPFTRLEDTVIQTCVVAAYGIAFSDGFGNYILAMSDRIASQTTESLSSNACSLRRRSEMSTPLERKLRRIL